ncbi:MAG: hypothetical protein PVS3B1_25790 [Ktedonobacteraceae bacterium]
MGGLPLALDQAGAYIEETRESLSNYIDLFRQQQAKLLKRRGGRISLKKDAREKTASDHLPVATTWSMAFEKIKQAEQPGVIELIRLCAFLTPDAIPEELLTENTSFFDPPLQAVTANRDAFNAALELLLDYSLISRDRTNHTLSLHRLIQAVIKNEMTAENHTYWSQVTINIVSNIFPFNEPAPWPTSLRYILNGLLAIEYINQWNVASDEANSLLNSIGTYFSMRGQYSESEPLFQRALAARERLLGPEHPDTLGSLNNLANLYDDQGKYDLAEPLYQRALAAHERILGPEHPDTLRSLNNLASLYADQGTYDLAQPLFQRALVAFEKVLGSEHPYTSLVRRNYADLQEKLRAHEE